jgi:putative intracellular protease/amidase
MGAAGKPTGAWLEKFTVPYYAIRDAGLLADIATTEGGAVPFDPRSTEEGSVEVPENRRLRSDPELQAAVQTTPSVEQVRFDHYAAVFLPGGHVTRCGIFRTRRHSPAGSAKSLLGGSR